jgi:CO/xanthine dehydrogenase FAD-binding subunit
VLRRSLREALDQESRNAITVEQAVRSADLAPPWIAALLALSARVNSMPEAEEAALADVWARGAASRGRIAAVHVPGHRAGRVTGEAYLVSVQHQTPVLAAIAVVEVSEGLVRQARLALAGVWRQPARLADSAELLRGFPPMIRRIRLVAQATGQEVAACPAASDQAGYCGGMASLLAWLALAQCWKKSAGI